jgi:hypothetical protein
MIPILLTPLGCGFDCKLDRAMSGLAHSAEPLETRGRRPGMADDREAEALV